MDDRRHKRLVKQFEKSIKATEFYKKLQSLNVEFTFPSDHLHIPNLEDQSTDDYLVTCEIELPQARDLTHNSGADMVADIKQAANHLGFDRYITEQFKIESFDNVHGHGVHFSIPSRFCKNGVVERLCEALNLVAARNPDYLNNPMTPFEKAIRSKCLYSFLKEFGASPRFVDSGQELTFRLPEQSDVRDVFMKDLQEMFSSCAEVGFRNQQGFIRLNDGQDVGALAEVEKIDYREMHDKWLEHPIYEAKVINNGKKRPNRISTFERCVRETEFFKQLEKFGAEPRFHYGDREGLFFKFPTVAQAKKARESLGWSRDIPARGDGVVDHIPYEEALLEASVYPGAPIDCHRYSVANIVYLPAKHSIFEAPNYSELRNYLDRITEESPAWLQTLEPANEVVHALPSVADITPTSKNRDWTDKFSPQGPGVGDLSNIVPTARWSR